jgi:hypothetical protein
VVDSAASGQWVEVDLMGVAIAVVIGLVGAACVVLTVISAVLTVTVPRGTPVRITRLVFTVMGVVFISGSKRLDYRRRDRFLALYAPLSLLALPFVWLVLVLAGYTAMYWALGVRPWQSALLESVSSLLTLGFRVPVDAPTTALVFSEAALGLGLLALLISYLPSIYASYSRREVMVTGLEAQAGSPPFAGALLERLARIDGFDTLDEFWREWARWFADIEETHTTTPSLVYFRSPQPSRSWVTAAGAVLDAAAIVMSTVDIPPEPWAALCVRAGYVALRRIGDYYAIPHSADPAPDDPISVSREEYEEVCERLVAAGARLKPDRDQTWRDFAGWRVNYDDILIALASLSMAPTAPWSADRAIPYRFPPILRLRTRPRL